MATTAVQEFLDKVGQDQALQAELGQAMEAENDREAVTELGKSKGYNFSPEELWAEVQKRQAESQKTIQAGELSDAELEEVAGGATPTTVALTIVSAGGVASASAGLSVNKIKW